MSELRGNYFKVVDALDPYHRGNHPESRHFAISTIENVVLCGDSQM